MTQEEYSAFYDSIDFMEGALNVYRTKNYIVRQELSIENIEGYRFDGWYSDKEHTNKLDLTQTLSDIKVIYGKYIKLINVTLNVAGTETTLVVDEGTDVNIFADIEADIIEGYEFEGWYSDELRTQKVEEVTASTSKLYARIPNMPTSYLEETADGQGYQIVRSATDTLEGISTLVIPITYNGKPVTEIADGADRYSGTFSQSGITAVSIPNTITTIGKFAFADCTNLVDITIPSSIIDLNQGCFAYCSSLKYIEIPSSVATYEDRIFICCTSLEEIKLPNNITVIPYGLAYKCTALTKVNIPYGVTKIDQTAFRECSSLETIELPNSITELGVGAFISCVNLKNVVLPNRLTKMDQHVFDGCTSLTSIDIPQTVRYIGIAAFQHCTELTTVTGFDTLDLEYIGTHAFNQCTKLESISLPNSINIITNFMFSFCEALTNIVIPTNITKIEPQAFNGCANLTSIEFTHQGVWKVTTNTDYTEGEVIDITDSSVNVLMLTNSKEASENPGYAEYYWYNSTLIQQTTGELSSSWLQFDEDSDTYTVIRGADSLPNHLTIPKMYNGYPIVAIADNAFKDCTELLSVQFEEGSLITTIGTYAFSGASIGSVVIPNNVVTISNYAFYGCKSLQNVTLSNQLVTIGEAAFSNCHKLNSIVIPNSVTAIGRHAFSACRKLADITFEENSQLVSIGDNAFKEVAVESITIPGSVTRIGSYAFKDCANLTSITFEDIDDWYKTLTSNYMNGELVDVSDSTQNATRLKSSEDNEYANYYLYKETVTE